MKNIYRWFMVCLVVVVVLAGCAAPKEEATVGTESETSNGTSVSEENSNPASEGTVNEELSEDEAVNEEASNVDGLLSLTVEELAAYNGEDDMPAYVAVDGVIYDVTDVPAWRNGAHNGNFAGNDLTEEINKMSPHGTKVLENLTVVGELVQ